MRKVIVIVCSLGNPCVVFEQDPVKYHKNYNDCMAVAKEKHDILYESFSTYGYQVESSEFRCENNTY